MHRTAPPASQGGLVGKKLVVVNGIETDLQIVEFSDQYKVVLFISFDQAFEVVKREKPDLVILFIDDYSKEVLATLKDLIVDPLTINIPKMWITRNPGNLPKLTKVEVEMPKPKKLEKSMKWDTDYTVPYLKPHPDKPN